MTENPFTDAASITRNQAEYHLQIAVVAHLESAFKGKMIWTAFPGRPGDAEDGFFKKAMGVKPGVPDLLFWWVDATHKGVFKHFGAIELKAFKGRVSNDQNRWASSFVNIGGKFAMCKSVKEVHDALVSWRLKPAHDKIVEPDIRSTTQKFHDAFEFYRWED